VLCADPERAADDIGRGIGGRRHGSARHCAMTKDELDSARLRLLERRSRVLARVHTRRAAIGDELDSREIEDNENARELEDEVEAAQLTGIEERTLAAIDVALRRIDNGSYGRCAVDGGPIEPERLAAVPEATLCIEHAVGAEREQGHTL
jgi:RNA polymerase-binding transcription factor DksA